MQANTHTQGQEQVQDRAQTAAQILQQALTAAGSIILGKPERLRLALACLLARGHLLIEDLPGVGKTTLAQTLAQVLGLAFKRVQFTSDLLPGDIIGVSIFNRQQQSFSFQPGPVFTQVLLADEINRASPKTQSALLEAMEEQQISVDGVTHPLPQPFFVIATQNPGYQLGTFALPESQLDRFLMRIDLGYPQTSAELELLQAQDRRELLAATTAQLNAESLLALQAQCQRIHTSAQLLHYILALLQASRRHPRLREGLSPRAGLALKHCAQAWAMLDGREHVLPEDIQAVFTAVAAHRLQAHNEYTAEHSDGAALAAELLSSVAIP